MYIYSLNNSSIKLKRCTFCCFIAITKNLYYILMLKVLEVLELILEILVGKI